MCFFRCLPSLIYVLYFIWFTCDKSNHSIDYYLLYTHPLHDNLFSFAAIAAVFFSRSLLWISFLICFFFCRNQQFILNHKKYNILHAGDIIGNFIQRATTQLNHVRHLMRTLFDVVTHSIPETGELTRDAFGLHTIIVVVTSTGKVSEYRLTHFFFQSFHWYLIHQFHSYLASTIYPENIITLRIYQILLNSTMTNALKSSSKEHQSIFHIRLKFRF